MTFVRPARRVLIAAVSLSALLVAAACGGDEPGGGSRQRQRRCRGLTKKGPIEVWQGKDTSGNFPKLIDKFNEQHPDGKVTFLELPDSADQQRQQMIQNTQIKNPTRWPCMSMDVVWTAEFAANGYVDRAARRSSSRPTTFLPATVDSATYFNKLYAYPSDLRRRPAVLPQGSAGQVPACSRRRPWTR